VNAMIAAIYARKSTEQHGVVDDQKSTTRQVDHARCYVQRKGWTVQDASIFVDDGVSGALPRRSILGTWRCLLTKTTSIRRRNTLELVDLALEWKKQFEEKGWTA
jgi:hypothetical protein